MGVGSWGARLNYQHYKSNKWSTLLVCLSFQGIFWLWFWTAHFALTEVCREPSCSHLLVSIYTLFRVYDKDVTKDDSPWPMGEIVKLISSLHSAAVGVLECPCPLLISTWLSRVIYLPCLLLGGISALFLMSLVFKRPAVNGVNNGEECAQWGPLTMVKTTGYHDLGFHACA